MMPKYGISLSCSRVLHENNVKNVAKWALAAVKIATVQRTNGHPSSFTELLPACSRCRRRDVVVEGCQWTILLCLLKPHDSILVLDLGKVE